MRKQEFQANRKREGFQVCGPAENRTASINILLINLLKPEYQYLTLPPPRRQNPVARLKKNEAAGAIGDMVLVVESGYEILNRFPRELIQW